jgi:hypothetical protein
MGRPSHSMTWKCCLISGKVVDLWRAQLWQSYYDKNMWKALIKVKRRRIGLALHQAKRLNGQLMQL